MRRLPDGISVASDRIGIPEVVGVAALLLAFVVPYVLLGQDSFVLIHDNLDSEFVYLTNLVRSGMAFDYGTDAVIPNVMNGLPRSALRSGLNVTVLLFHVFDPFVAYVSNALFVRLIAFAGMLLLLRRHLMPRPEERGVAVVMALLFALLPFYSLYGLSVAGQPLLLSAYVDVVRRAAKWWDWLVLGLFPFYSLLYMSGIFILGVFGLFALYLCIRGRCIVWPALAPVLILGIGYAVVEWPLIWAVLGESSWTSHRVEFVRGGENGRMVRTAARLLALGHYHAATLPTLPIVVSLGLAGVPLLRSRHRRLAIGVAAGILLVAVLHAVYTPILLRYLGDAVPVLGMVQLDRFYFLLPVGWFILFGLALSCLKGSRGGRIAIFALLLGQTSAIFATSDEIRTNVAALTGRTDYVSFREFFAPDLFTVIQRKIGQPPDRYRVVSVGLHPSISQYNGLHTLDGYQNNYPLSYKQRFRPIIAEELARDPSLESYFDDWGNRCYVFSAELGRNFLLGKGSGEAIRELSIDVEQLRSLGGTHLISSVPIENHRALKLRLLGTFESQDSHWRIHLYETS